MSRVRITVNININTGVNINIYTGINININTVPVAFIRVTLNSVLVRSAPPGS